MLRLFFIFGLKLWQASQNAAVPSQGKLGQLRTCLHAFTEMYTAQNLAIILESVLQMVSPNVLLPPS